MWCSVDSVTILLNLVPLCVCVLFRECVLGEYRGIVCILLQPHIILVSPFEDFLRVPSDSSLQVIDAGVVDSLCVVSHTIL